MDIQPHLPPSDSDKKLSSVIQIQVSTWMIFLLAAILIVPWIILAFCPLYARSPHSSGETRLSRWWLPSNFSPGAGANGPWGELEYVPIQIEPPDDFVSADNYTPRPIHWTFRNFTYEQLSDLWSRAGLSDRQINALAGATQAQTAIKGFRLTPSKELVAELTPEQRRTIYTVLAGFPENESQANPFRFRADRAEEWFANSDLRPEILRDVRRYVYPRGTALLFSDLDLILPLIPSARERNNLLKTLARKSTMLMKLVVNPGQDIDPLVRYWSKGGRAKDIEPLLRSLTLRPQKEKIDIVHLLPPFARRRLYTYPVPSEDLAVTKQDCYWTCMNFFKREPDDRFTDGAYVSRVLRSEYDLVPVRPTYGDLVILTKQNGQAVHGAVYIADNILFTKNGSHHSIPWLLMKLEDVVAFYPSDEPLQVHIYRLRQS